jgi:hypothetical protein
MEQPPVTIGAMRGTARLVIKSTPERPNLRPVRDDESETDRPEPVEKDEEHGR